MYQILSAIEPPVSEHRDLYFHLDEEGRLQQWNIEFEQLINLSFGELLNKPFIELVTEADQKYIQLSLVEGFRLGNYEFRTSFNHDQETVEYLIRIWVNRNEMDDSCRLICFGQVVNRLANSKKKPLHKRLQDQHAALFRLSQHRHQSEDDLTLQLDFVTETVARTLSVERASIWLLDELRAKFSCVNLYDRNLNLPGKEMVLQVKDYTVYFKAIENERSIAINDATTDPRTAELREHYLKPYGISAMLVAPLRVNGDVMGVVCHESKQGVREWQMDEETFAGSVADYVALTLEVFKHRESGKKLARTTDEWDFALDTVEDTLFIVDLEDRLIRANRNFFSATGLLESTTIGKDIKYLLHPESRAMISGMRDGDINHNEITLFLDVNDPYNFINRAVELVVRIVRDNTGVAYGVLYYYRDLTRIRDAEKSYHELHEYINVVLDSTSEGIIAVDKEMNCTFMNNAATSILGFGIDEILGRDIHSLIQHSDEDGNPMLKTNTHIYQTILLKKGYQDNKAIFWSKNNYCLHVQLSSNPVYKNNEVTGAVIIFNRITDAKAIVNTMNYMARHDSLTGLVNRYEFDLRLEAALNDAKQNNKQYVLLYMDLDQFKIVNDTCGHVIGDELLKELSLLLEKEVRSGDTLARLGGDEFGVILQNCNPGQAQRVAKKLQSTIRDFRFNKGKNTISVGVSIGVISITKHSKDIATILSLVDSACFLAKEEGRNRIHVYHQNDEELALRHGEMQWVSRIKNALENDLLVLYFQPITPVDRNRPGDRHIEILLRMKDDNNEIILPGAFIPAAERYNLMSEVDRWVLKNTFMWMSSEIQFKRHLICSINLSGQSLGDEGFYDYLIEQLNKYAINPSAVCFEITETAAVANLGRAIKFIKELKQLGCKFSLDDFGSGLSSFTYLKNLPVDYLKIDGHLVKDIAVDVVNYSMVEAINRVGCVMGIQTIAEFVENKLIAEKLHEIGVDFAQGFGIAKPAALSQAKFLY